jgi:transcriptional regulator with XRE-family HTH domain
LARESSIEPVLRELGMRIRAARNLVGRTQEDTAAKAGIDYKRYQNVELGLVNVTMKTLVRIAVALDTTFWILVSAREHSARRVPRERRR